MAHGAADRRSGAPWAAVLFAAALLVYAATRLIALDRFPIFFHADEAFGPLTASDLLANGLHDAYGRWLPMYFQPAPNRWMPIGTVYAHLVSVALFGRSVLVTRATTAVVSIAGAAAVALTLRDAFGQRRWWAGALVLGAMPTWFLHSRAGFEAAMMVAMFAVFVWTYLRYRRAGGRGWACAAVTAGAATFYAYSNGQSVMAVMAAALLVVDGAFHWRHRRALWPALVLALLLAVPFVRFRLAHPGAERTHLRAINAYLVDPSLSPGQKAIGFARRYAFGLHPRFWFISHDVDHVLAPLERRWPKLTRVLTLGDQLVITRHRYRGRGPLALWMAPFFAIGLVRALRRWRSPPERTLLLAMAAAPVGAALAEIGITRVMAFLVPAALLIALGLEAVVDAVERRTARAGAAAPWGAVFTTGLFAALAAANVELLATALRTGDRWYDDYGLYGMQWGAPQIFTDVVPSLLASDPDVQVLLTSDWANAADRFPAFFLSAEQARRILARSVSELFLRKADLSGDLVWLVTDHELGTVKDSGKFDPPEILRTLPWPDGRAGFHAVRLRYKAGIDTVFAAERAERRKLVDAAVNIAGQAVAVRHSVADMGVPADMFDGDDGSLLRGLEANPLIVELAFTTPRPLTGLEGRFAHMPFTWTIELFAPASDTPVTYTQTLARAPEGDSGDSVAFDRGPPVVAWMRITIHQDDVEDVANIHVRELVLR